MKGWWGGGAVIIGMSGLAFAFMVFADRISPQPAQVELRQEVEQQKPISLVLVGDIMLDRGVKRSVGYNFSGDYNQLFAHTPYLKDADIAFGNLEGPVGTAGKLVGSKYSFHMDPIVISVLKAAGFDIFSFANNHVGDYSLDAFNETRSLLEQQNILYAGAGGNYADASAVRTISVRGMKIGFLAASDVGPEWIAAGTNRSGILLASDPNLIQIIQTAKAQVDILVVSFHWGEEYKVANDRQQVLAHTAIDAGADIIVGHHPHVVQRVESYNGKPIFYSLGNYIFDQYFSPETMQGLVANVLINHDKTIRYTTSVSKLDSRFQPQEIVNDLPLELALVSMAISEQTCPKPKATGVNLNLVSIPVPYSLIGYIPDGLVPIGTKDTGEVLCAKQEAVSALRALQAAIAQVNLGIGVTLAYRAEADQAEIKSDFDAIGKMALVADVGSSEHQLGTAFDLYAISGGTFGASKEYQWMQKNAAAYGFVQSYGSAFETENGYPGEPWHWRYVGKSLAQKIKASGKPVNTYLKLIGN